jgi:hypothetical protein
MFDPTRRALLIGSVFSFFLPGSARLDGTLQDQPRQRVSVKNFGAIGNGIGDDTAAINAAIARCAAGQELFFPAGRYLVSISDGLEKTLDPIPWGVDVFMDPDAWIFPSTREGRGENAITVFTPRGNNRFQVNIDGRSLPERSVVESEDWINNAHGIRAYHSEAHGLGATDVTVENSRFRNLRFAIQTEGAKRWNILNNRFERTMLSAILMGYSNGNDCLNHVVRGNFFEDMGDTAWSLYGLVGSTTGQGAHILVSDNYAKNYCLRAAGYAYGVEEGDIEAQHHIQMIGNIAEHTRTDLPHAIGGLTMGYVSHGLMRGNSVKGAWNSNADIGFNMLRCRHGLITQNVAQNWLGAGISTDGGNDVHAVSNQVVNCGGMDANSLSIRLAFVFDTQNVSARENIVTMTAEHPHHGAGAIAIGASANTGRRVRDVAIVDNVIDSPLDIGIAAYGAPGFPMIGVNVAGNRIRGGAPGFFRSWAVYLSRVEQGTISRTIIENAMHGFNLQNCSDVAVSDTQITGRAPLTVGYNLAGSTNIRIRNTRCDIPVITAVADPGRGNVWESDDIAGSRSS